MLTMEALEDRKWHGLDFLRSLLQKEAKLIEPSLHPFASTSESKFESIQRVLYLAAIVEAVRSHVLTAVGSSEPREVRRERARQADAELQQLAGAVRFAEHEASEALRHIESLRRDIYEVASK